MSDYLGIGDPVKFACTSLRASLCTCIFSSFDQYLYFNIETRYTSFIKIMFLKKGIFYSKKLIHLISFAQKQIYMTNIKIIESI